jgi:hypothetical protein
MKKIALFIFILLSPGILLCQTYNIVAQYSVTNRGSGSSSSYDNVGRNLYLTTNGNTTGVAYLNIDSSTVTIVTSIYFNFNVSYDPTFGIAHYGGQTTGDATEVLQAFDPITSTVISQETTGDKGLCVKPDGSMVVTTNTNAHTATRFNFSGTAYSSPLTETFATTVFPSRCSFDDLNQYVYVSALISSPAGNNVYKLNQSDLSIDSTFPVPTTDGNINFIIYDKQNQVLYIQAPTEFYAINSSDGSAVCQNTAPNSGTYASIAVDEVNGEVYLAARAGSPVQSQLIIYSATDCHQIGAVPLTTASTAFSVTYDETSETSFVVAATPGSSSNNMVYMIKKMLAGSFQDSGTFETY